jgi:hypothetical protein
LLSVVFASPLSLPFGPATADALIHWPGLWSVSGSADLQPHAVPAITCGVDPDDEEDTGDEEDLAVSQPLADEESSFDDFDDEFDDDFEEEENDPDWDHPDEGDETPPPGKGKK